MTCEFGMTDKEYFDSTPYRIALKLEYKRPKKIGNLHEDEIERLDQRRAEAEANGIKVI